MPSKAKRMGFAGTDSYDLIMYLAVLLIASDKKVLLVDNSLQKALSCCVPPVDMTSVKERKACYRGLDIQKETYMEVMGEEYDYVLADFGQEMNQKALKTCDTVFLVTDTRLHNMTGIEYFRGAWDNTCLLIRDITEGMEEKYIHKLLQEKGIQERRSYYFYFDETDREMAAMLQYYNSFSYKKLSPAIRYFLKDALRGFFGMDEAQLNLAEKKLKRRKWDACGFLGTCGRSDGDNLLSDGSRPYGSLPV
ncbi:hypothetical protein [Anaerocolumna xylanovorans]|uniref:Uncharacterized protein n=1 Tax=Anaerocolumna xylanovorans DSM 12503 TaxID=1121345 RepID=A0A1M7Y440_9FIRM|nr:hypothetical protein [Anaerocolumna xylanovorans]SHO47036.1 hypothetical protein SAMN02745217_01373 [Anaerocolumna xylanovorans DSM 12503]